MRPFKSMSADERLEVARCIALTCGNAEYAATLWSGGHWTWYALLRECLLDAVETGNLQRLSRAQNEFVRFPQDYLAPEFPAGTLERVMFETRLRAPAGSRARAALPAPLPIDNCPALSPSTFKTGRAPE